MNKSETIGKLAKALSQAQNSMESAVKDSMNPHLKSRYADLSSIWSACRDALGKAELSIVQMPCDADGGRVALSTTLMHSSGEWISTTVSTRVAKDDPQSLGSALTYLRRYSLAAMVGVTTTDDDGEEAVRPSSAPVQQSNRVQPVVSTLTAAETINKAQIQALQIELKKMGFGDNERDDKLSFVAWMVKRTLTSSKELTLEEAKTVLTRIKNNDPSELVAGWAAAQGMASSGAA